MAHTLYRCINQHIQTHKTEEEENVDVLQNQVQTRNTHQCVLSSIRMQKTKVEIHSFSFFLYRQPPNDYNAPLICCCSFGMNKGEQREASQKKKKSLKRTAFNAPAVSVFLSPFFFLENTSLSATVISKFPLLMDVRCLKNRKIYKKKFKKTYVTPAS